MQIRTLRFAGLFAVATLTLPAQAPVPATVAPATSYTVEAGTRIALGLISSISTKSSSVGEKVYLETVFPIVVRNHVVIPPGSHVSGTVTLVKRPGRLKGKGELYVRFDSLILPNGITREFRSRLSGIDARGSEHLDKEEGVIKGDSNKGGDVKTVATGGMAGASLGGIIARNGMGAGLGGAAGAAAGLAGVLFTRGPDAVLAKGSTVEMVLDRPLTFESSEVTFTGYMQGTRFSDGPGPAQQTASGSTTTLPVRRIQF